MKLAAMFFWIALPITAYVVYALHGLPHVIWRYRFVDNGDANNPHVERYYTECTFTGPYGQFTVSADTGRCGWIAFFTPPPAQ